MEAPPATSFAPLNDETRVPHIKDNGRAAYRKWLEAERPRAFAISPKGAWGWAYGGDDPLQRALDLCNGGKRTDCKLYSVDDQVVWPEGQP
jgi:hypothetical protein